MTKQDADLLRLALAKIEELQGQVKELQGSETTTATPATTPRGSPANGSTPTTNTSAKKTTEKGDGHNSDDDDREEPIRTPDGVAVPWLQTHDLYNSFMYPF